MGCVTSEVSDAELIDAAKRVTPGAWRWAVREWRVSGSPSETSIRLFAAYSVRFVDKWLEIASGPTAGHLIARLLTMQPIKPPWKIDR